jgi:hypothetical protein
MAGKFLSIAVAAAEAFIQKYYYFLFRIDHIFITLLELELTSVNRP